MLETMGLLKDTKQTIPYQVAGERVEGLLGLLDLFGRSLKHNLVRVGSELDMHLGEVLGDLLHILALASDDEAMEPLRGVDLLYSYTVGLLINLQEGMVGALLTRSQTQNARHTVIHSRCLGTIKTKVGYGVTPSI